MARCGTVVRVLTSLGCPSCLALAGNACRRRDGRSRVPHRDRIALVLATLVLAWLTDNVTTAGIASNLTALIEAEHTLKRRVPTRPPHLGGARPGHDDDADLSDEAQRPAPAWEHAMLLLADRLQHAGPQMGDRSAGESRSTAHSYGQGSPQWTADGIPAQSGAAITEGRCG
ncbi:hypothetical protein AB0C27_55785 [Nonomuraea sp. NPDC048882]|uniref:zinc finger domain-containing protein n=1 Tax=Nonomuraea sp. NPDC048882 TaxID=3154347 RepID=UPI0033C6185E